MDFEKAIVAARQKAQEESNNRELEDRNKQAKLAAMVVSDVLKDTDLETALRDWLNDRADYD